MASKQDNLTGAIFRGDVSAVRSLLATGASPNDADRLGKTPLMQAAEMENAEIIRLLLAAGADVNGKGLGGNTPLRVAVDISIDGTVQAGGMPGSEPTAIIDLLLAAGADLAATDDRGETAIDCAKKYDSKKIVRHLQSRQCFDPDP